MEECTMQPRSSYPPKKSTMRETRRHPGETRAIVGCFIVLMLAATIVTSGCINKVMPGASTAPMPEISLQTTPVIENQSALPAVTHVPVAQIPVVEMTPAKSEAVIEVAPILTPDPYPILHATRINATPLSDRLNRAQIFKKTYHLTGGAEGLLVNVAEGPMYIVYIVTPQNDCLTSPDSCKGDMEKPVQRPYMTLTVRDNQTHEILVQDGYAREYSSDTGNYEFSVTSKSTQDTLLSSASYAETTTTSTPGPRYIPIYKEGTFHITIEGAYVDTDLKILTGPTLEGLTETDLATAPTAESSPEEEWG